MHDDDEFPGHFHDEIERAEAGLSEVKVEDIEGLEMFRLRSVGIDIGSSTSHLIFSRLTLRREGAALSSQFRVTEREVLYRSEILLTPYVSGTLIDTEKLQEFFHAAYVDAGFTAEEVDTGAVVITGEALKKENAEPISDLFSRESGKFICASAGPNHEALLAAYGCGAVALSETEKATVLNVDCGGGTAKLSLIRDGVVAQTAAVEVGARLIAFDSNGMVTRLEDPAIRMMRELGHTVTLGKAIPQKEQEEFAALMVKVLFEAIQGATLSPLTQELMLTEPLRREPGFKGIDLLVFSGGVSEYIYGYHDTNHGDMGPLYGAEIRKQLRETSGEPLLREPAEGIRATVIGAGEYTVQASGTTSYIGNVEALPVFGLKVVRPVVDGLDTLERAVKDALSKFDLPRFTSGLALALSVEGQPDYPFLRSLAEGIHKVVQETDSPTAPVFLVLDMDVAKSLGSLLKEELHMSQDLVAIDGIDVGDLDYVDIGRPMGMSEVLPVTVKSLMFPSSHPAS